MHYPTFDEVVAEIKLQQQNPGAFLEKLKAVEEVRPLYTYAGTLEQIELFIKDPLGPNGGYLRCVRHPKTLRCCDGSDRNLPKRRRGLQEEESESAYEYGYDMMTGASASIGSSINSISSNRLIL
jgi:hypothetical protein